MTNKIGWCDMTWNPVWGCLNHCEYCYARKIAKRFYRSVAKKEYDPNGLSLPGDGVSLKIDYLKRFVPRFLHSQFNKKFPKKPQRIFVGSMSEIYYWNEEWIEKVIEKVKQSPQHTFQFLTKFPMVYVNWKWPENCILGVTITKEEDFEKDDDSWYYFFNEKNKTFFSFEPLLEMIGIEYLQYSNIDWVIIGAETGNRKGKIVPKRNWVLDIVHYCRVNNIPIYLKDNLEVYLLEDIKEFPKEVNPCQK